MIKILETMKLRETIEYGAVEGLLGLCRILPKSVVYGLFNSLGILAYGLLASRRKLALNNTAIAFPEKSLAERKRIVRQSFLILSESMALNAMIMSGRVTTDDLLNMIDEGDIEKMRSFVRSAENKGAFMFSAHFGNWELAPQFASLKTGKPIHVIARKSNNALIEERIVLPLRERFGVNIIYKKNAMMKMLKAMKRGDIIGILVDQRLSLRKGKGAPAEFFGKITGTTSTLAQLQIRLNAPAAAAFMVRLQRGRYKFIVKDPVVWADNGKPLEEQVLELTQIQQNIVEDIIREYPEQWFWVHDRWGIIKDKK